MSNIILIIPAFIFLIEYLSFGLNVSQKNKKHHFFFKLFSVVLN